MTVRFQRKNKHAAAMKSSTGKRKRSNVIGRVSNRWAAQVCAEALEPRMYLSGTGLTGQYFNTSTLTGYTFNETDAQVNFSWGDASPGHGLASNNFSARWEGVIEPTTTGNYTFYIAGDGGEELSVNGYNIINNWTSHSTQDTSAVIALNANTTYDIELEYFSTTTSAATALSWSVSGGNTTLVPSTVLYPLTTGPGAYTPTAGNTAAATPSTSGMPAGWSFADIGGSSPAGSSTYNSSTGVFTINGGGTLVAGVNDQFQYAYTQITGDFTFIAQLTSMTDPNNGAMVGEMMRTALTASVPEFFLGEQPSQIVWAAHRLIAGSSEESINSGSLSNVPDPYLKIVRGGNTVDGYYSTDDVNWTYLWGQQFNNLPSTIYVGLAGSSRISSTLSTSTFANIAITSPNNNNATAFVANTFGGGEYHIIDNATAGYVDPGTGQLLVNGIDEGYSLSIFNPDGSVAAFGDNSHFLAGSAIYADSSTIYYAQDNGSLGKASGDLSGLQRYNRYGIAFDSAILANDTVTGITEAAGYFYVATDNNMVYQFAPSTLNFTGLCWEVDRAANMAADASGNLWIIQNAGSGYAAQVTQYTSAGVATGLTITFPTGSYGGNTVVPTGIAVDLRAGATQNQVYITDIGPLQNVDIYNGGNGSLIATFGNAYGIYGGTTPGADAPLKFNYPVGVGIDNSGNIYVVDGYPNNYAPDYIRLGTSIRKFTNGGVELWEDNNYEYVSVAAADPASPNDIYTIYWHLNANYNNTLPGDDSSSISTLIDPFLYPTDPRLIPATIATYPTYPAEFGRTSPIIRSIDGAKFLFDFDQQGTAINVYRFVPGTDYTVFCDEFQFWDHSGYSDNSFYLWVDSNGDGVKQTSEESFSTADLIGQSFGQYVDSSGNVWLVDRTHNEVWEYKVGAALNSIGAPVYSFANAVSWSAPSAIPSLQRALYDAATNTMFLAGYTTANPDPSGTGFWGQAGSTLFAYTNWSSKGGNQNAAWSAVFPNNLTTNPVKGLDIAGNYIFGISFLGQSGVEVYSQTTGALAATLMPTPYANSDDSDTDFLDPLNATELASGQYEIYTENDAEGDSTLYQWTPNISVPAAGWTDQDIDSPGGAGSASYNVLNQTWTDNGAGYGIGNSSGTVDQLNLSSTTLTGDGAINADITSFTDTYSSAGNAMLVMRANNTPGAVEAVVALTPSGNAAFYYRTVANAAIQSFTLANSSLGYVKIVRSGGNFSGYFSGNGATWTQIGATVAIPAMPQTVLAGLAVGSHADPNIATATFTSVTVAPALAGADIGSPAISGATLWDNYKQTYSISGSGTGIQGAADQLQFASLIHGGNGAITAKLASLTVATTAQAGVMFRNSTAPGDPYAAVLVGPNGVSLQWRATGNGATSSTTVAGVVGPIWVQLVRSGSTFTGYFSDNDVTWTQIGTPQTLGNISSNATAGLAISSGNASAAATAVFGQVSVDSPLLWPTFGNLTASASMTYGTAWETFAGSIAAGTSVPPNTETVAITLNGVTQNATINSPGNFSTTITTSTLPASATAYQITYAYAGDTTFNVVTDGTTTTLTVNKATPAMTWASPAAITYGTALSGTQLDATAGTPGSFVYSPASGTVLHSGTQSLSATFTPSDATDYTTATGNVTLTVNKAVLTVTANNQSRAYGVANPTLTYSFSGFVNSDASSVVGGIPSLSTTAATASTPNLYPITITANTLSAADYSFNLLGGNLTVTQAATSTVVTSSIGTSSSGQSVTFTATVTPASGSGETGAVQFQIDGGNVGSPVTISGSTATYAISSLSIGNHTVLAIYSGDGNFTASTSPAFIQGVSQAAWLSATSAATWSAGNLTLTVTGNATIIGDPNKFGVEPVIDDSGNAANLTVDTQIADGGDGDATVHLSTVSGNGTTAVIGTGLLVSGNFSQAALVNNGTVEIDSAGTIGQLTGSGNLTIGNGSSHNTLQLAPAAIPDSFTNAQQALTIIAGSTLDITDNTLLLNYGAGSSPLAAVRSAVGNGAIISTSANAGNPGAYTVGYGEATELGSVPTGNVKLMYTLTGDAQLTETVNFDDFSVLQNNYNQTGRDWAQADFNHDGMSNFNDYSMLQNNYGQWVKATPTLTWPAPAAITYGIALSATQLDATASVAGTLAYTPAAGMVLSVGTQSLAVTFTPTDATDYTTATTSVNLTVNKAATTTAVTSSSSLPLQGQPVTFTATITPANGGSPTGTVQFQIDGGNIGTPVAVGNSAASYSVSALTLGNHTVAAIYSGDGNFTASTAPTITQPVGLATVTYTLSINDDGTDHYCAGHYAVYASDSLNNAGLASYDIHLGGAATITNYSPKGNYDDGTGCGSQDAIGFTYLRSANNTTPATASQDTVDYASGGKVILVYGMAQTAANLAADKAPGSTGAVGATTQAVYGSPLELLKGTFTGAAPTFTSQSSDTGNVFLTSVGYGTQAATLAFSTVTVLSGSFAPATAALPAKTPIAAADLTAAASLVEQFGWTEENILGYLL